MNLVISDEAANWYKDEIGLKNGDKVRFFARYGGSSKVQSGFSLGVSIENETRNIGVETNKQGIIFYIEEEDFWYFDGHDLSVEFNSTADEPEFEYQK
ncbi:hypothetical protein ELQ35_14015 [Peribacillus cavernae]|uniref:FeS cluster biogenesis domain-containing protein n=1 Tax=Peribacillus cavernae TaxID=1674310 RepID=A0A433HIM0_9BACI|nr:HesB/YadR/YfhF family protein [Peribacillus cavernae]MDQ0220478.1 uncharacterized protein YneR [Peribacillus cavernae]RUQ28023.1 hypothetical protein ELQ35_14015 [Peribacillus cavernae]